jgi:predicted metal-dependent phosphoesterase TrpH
VLIDLHTHSTESDGTKTPAEVMRLAAEAGLYAVALSDHDNPNGWAEAAQAATASGVGFVPAMELSTIYSHAGVHLLAYLADPTYPPLAAELIRIISGRDSRLPRIISALQSAGVDITEREVMVEVAGAAAIGRPHVADALVRKGVVADRTQAFERWLSYGTPGYVVRYATPLLDMLELVRGAGGVSVIAHPWGRASRRVLDADTLAMLTDAGLSGIEVDHQDHDAADRAELRVLAQELGLVVTGSSDYHGDGKVDHELGCNTTDPGQFARLLDLADASARESGRPTPKAVL